MSEFESNYDKEFQPRLPNGDIIDAKNTCASIDTNLDSQNNQHINQHNDENNAVAATPIHTTSTIVIPSDGVYPVENDVEFQHTPYGENVNIRSKDTSSNNEPIVTSGSWFSKRNTYIFLAILFVTTIGLIGFVVGTYLPPNSPTSSPTFIPSNTTTATPTFIPANITAFTPTVSPTISASIEQIVVEFLSNITLSNQPITLDGFNPESKAMTWMIRNDPWILDTPIANLATSLNSIQNNERRFRIIQRYSLLTLWFQQDLTTPPLKQWRVTTGWLEPNECFWYGLTCHTSFFIDGVAENYTNVIGQIDFNDFTNNLGNNLVGSIPADFGLLSHLILFDVTSCGLTGTLPESIGRWSDMTEFYAANNSISGELPSSIGNWSNLSVFSIAICNFTGTLPESIGYWRNMVDVRLFSNQLTGPLPESIGELTALTSFAVYGNSLIGTIPESIGQLTALTSFFVYSNLFTGTLPKSIGQLTALTFFTVSRNQFNGTIPESIGNWSNIESAQFFNNQFTGSMPDSICSSISIETEDVLSADCELPCSCCTLCV